MERASNVSYTCKSLISRAFAPHVSVTSSDDTQKLCEEMGFNGFLDLLRPYGDKVSGRITARDSQNISISFEDFSIRFMGPVESRASDDSRLVDTEALEAFLQDQLKANQDHNRAAHLYTHFFGKTIAKFPVVPFESFSHPVAGIIAISSRNEAPIESLSALYHQSHESVPEYINKDYLRYYVLVHDEQSDDLDKSIALFEKMKRHFGVHCHMIRINRSEKTTTGVQIETRLQVKAPQEPENGEQTRPLLAEDDVSALVQFTRELVASSVIPFMERNVATWNDQVAASRRGITGRFFSASKKYFSAANKSPLLSSGGGSHRNNYNSSEGYYNYQSPEATLRKLADYAFMLRDYKFAHTTYDLLKRDFHNDKAWDHLAAAQEMSAISWLMHASSSGPAITTKSRNDNLDPMLDSAIYSYISRCSLPGYALRCILLSSELLCTQFNSSPSLASEGAARWILKALDERLVGRLGYALLMQRLSNVYSVHDEILDSHRPPTSISSSSPSPAPPQSSSPAVGGGATAVAAAAAASTTSLDSAVRSFTESNSGSTVNVNAAKFTPTTPRTRKAAFWMMLAAREWNDASQPKQSLFCLDAADELAYTPLPWTKSPAGLYGRLRRVVGGDSEDTDDKHQPDKTE